MHLKMYKMHLSNLLGGRRNRVTHSGVGSVGSPQNHPGEQEGLKEPGATALCLGETLG